MSKIPLLRKRYDKWAHVFSVNFVNITASALLIHLIGNPQFEKVMHFMEKYSYCCLDMDE